MNRRLRGLALFLVACYGALFIRLNVLQVFDADDLNTQPDNKRRIERDFNRPRGDIVTADGRLVAHSDEERGQFHYQRTYPTGDLFAHVVGTYSFNYGSSGVERRYHDQLSGRTADFQLGGITNPFSEEPNVGTVVLTLRSDVQEAAKQALGDRKGSVVAIDPRSGAVLALWSNPSYDPNLISTNDDSVAKAARDLLAASPDKPQLARSYQERYFPGSTFKIVTAAAGLESGKVTATTPEFPKARSYQPPLTTRELSNFDGSTCGGNVVDALRVSCNSVFAQMAAELLGPDPMIKEAEDFGFNQTVPIDLPQPAKSVFPTDFGKPLRDGANPGDAKVYENTPALAISGIGQGDVSATPLQMALVAAAVANGGTTMTPHVMAEIRDRDAKAVEKFDTSVWREVMTSANAEVLRSAMVDVVANGTASRLGIEGRVVGGKTGTAQLGTTPPRSHAWIIGFAGDPGAVPSVAVAVIVEGQPGASEQTGGKVAAPIARSVLEAALRPISSPQPGR
ncbi:MAG TPA: penicillin-binding transpeptidase domain-containing protein [Microthrixaceae bacterium]|nr:penicillin-binding protein 2 [Actinomycetota bacterium]HMS14504.1 penicillin-binding transpeptidase domain-containing protein [Microthrixaceae bacterium]HMT23604.1 penicillin-binding transpeptidase domain-containing protein [Microthrixaceae bacterium]HMT60012.1 penicillin-binding transpeptidase domain-containing protein [Microthrixaceae bacterium]